MIGIEPFKIERCVCSTIYWSMKLYGTNRKWDQIHISNRKMYTLDQVETISCLKCQENSKKPWRTCIWIQYRCVKYHVLWTYLSDLAKSRQGRCYNCAGCISTLKWSSKWVSCSRARDFLMHPKALYYGKI
jgi:hypothetical protein